MSEHTSCDGCKHDLGGGCCRINLEAECRDGGGFEAWEPEEATKGALECGRSTHINQHSGDCAKAAPQRRKAYD